MCMMERAEEDHMSNRAPRLYTAVVAFLSGIAVLAPAATRAAQGPEGQLGTVQGRAGAVSFSIGASVGAVGGEAYERVYAPQIRDFKVSELKWELQEIATLGVRGSLAFAGRYTLNFDYTAAVSEGNGEMVDRDWLTLGADSDEEWTDESRHPDTTVDSGTMIDFNLAVRAFTRKTFSLSGIVGIKRDEWKWSSRGGDYTYSVDRNEDGYISPDEYRSYRGSFPEGQLVISYKQEYTIPYLGLGCAGQWGAFSAQGRILFSPWVSAEDRDNHELRNILFEGDFSGGTFFGLGFEASYAFTPRIFATFLVDYENISEITGDMTYKPLPPEPAEFYPDGASVEIETARVAAMLGFKF
jgi:outer membrane protease